MTTEQLTADLKAKARAIGFDLVGVCPAVEPTGVSRLREWLQAGYAGEMRYLEGRQDAYTDPKSVLEESRSIVMLALNYYTAAPRSASSGEGLISRYAWGTRDYHDVIHEKLKHLVVWMRDAIPQAKVRGVVDTAPLFEREFAQLAGLGWIGKNTLLLNQTAGSWFFLGALLTDQVLHYDAAHETDHCGTCRACLDACPTDAFPRPYVLDATKCISYLTIELRNAIPHDLREGVGDWLFGCDICQDVCPWNDRVPSSNEPAFGPQAAHDPIALADLFCLSDEGFRRRFRKTALWRSKRRGILRNAAIILGNQRAVDSVSALTNGLQDAEPIVREACAWALGKMNTVAAITALRRQLDLETNANVRCEIRAALAS